MVKRFTIELPADQYAFLKKRAQESGATVLSLIRQWIAREQKQAKRKTRVDYTRDLFYQRRGSFDGDENLSEDHDLFLYGNHDGDALVLYPSPQSATALAVGLHAKTSVKF